MKLLAAKKSARDEILKLIEELTSDVSERKDDSFTSDESDQIDGYESDLEKLDKEIERLERVAARMPRSGSKRVTEPRDGSTRSERGDGSSAEGPDGETIRERALADGEIEALKRSADGSLVYVTRQPLTYEAHNRREADFLVDLFHWEASHGSTLTEAHARHGIPIDKAACDRIQAHLEETERRDSSLLRAVNTANFGAIVTPQYLIDMTAPGLYNGRVTGMMCARYPLPQDGVSFTIPRWTTKAVGAVQSVEGGDANDTSPDETDLTFSLSTVAAQTTLSVQAIERGRMASAFIEAELQGGLGEAINDNLLYGTGANGQAIGILRPGANPVNDLQNFTMASSKAVNVWQQLVLGLGMFANARKRAGDIIITSPMAWAMLYAAVDSNGRPAFQNLLGAARNVMGVGDPAMQNVLMPSAVGQIAGVDVVTDPAITDTFTNVAGQVGAKTGGMQSRFITARREDLVCFEDAQVPGVYQYEATKAATLQVLLVLRTYMAFTSGRYPTGARILKGTGTDFDS